jgi:hypothetical protein
MAGVNGTPDHECIAIVDVVNLSRFPDYDFEASAHQLRSDGVGDTGGRSVFGSSAY